jgi:hypothetical protein
MHTSERTLSAQREVIAAPLNCSIFLTDIMGFGDPRRDDHDRADLRSALLLLLTDAFTKSGLPWRRCRHQDRGDGFLTIVPPTLSTTLLIDPVLSVLSERLTQHNLETGGLGRMRLRCAIHVGPVQLDRAGFPNLSVIHAARMLDSQPLRSSLMRTDTDLAVMASSYVYEAVVRHVRGPAASREWRRSRYQAKGVAITSWLYLPHQSPDACQQGKQSGTEHR